MASFFKNGKKIVAIGRNYAAHIKELNNTTPTEPFFFLKPTSSYLASGGAVEIPKGVIVNHEIELGVIIGKPGRDISALNAMSHISGYCLAIDYTARNMQDIVKASGLPWSAVKGFDTFCPISNFINKTQIPDPHNLELYFKLNGVIKQLGRTDLMLYRIPELIRHVSSIMKLEEGDLLLTGTPAGVGPIVPGDIVIAGVTLNGKELARIEHTTIARSAGYEFKP